MTESIYTPIANRTRLILERIGANGLAQSVFDLFRQIEQRANKPILEALESYADLVHDFIRAVSEKGEISKELYSQMRGIHGAIQSALESSVYADSPSSQKDRRILEALHYMGGLTSLGQTSALSFFLLPEMLPLSLRLISLLDSPARKKHVSQIYKLRGIGEDLTKDKLNNIDSDVLEPVAKDFQVIIKDVVGQETERILSQAELELVRVEYLPTSADFYQSGIAYYKNPRWIKQSYFIFATTSGVLLPEDHYGSDYFRNTLPILTLYEASGKHPIRSDYFEVLGGSSQLNRFYYFEWTRAAKAFQSTLGAIRREAPKFGLDPESSVSQYKQSARESIVSFLGKRNFGLVGINSFPSQFNYLTLGNGQAVLVSSRDGDPSKQIAHGFMLHPTSGLAKYIRDTLSPEKLIRDAIPKPSDLILQHLGIALVKGFVLVITGGLRFLSAKRRREVAFNMVDRLKNSIETSKTSCNVIKLPGGRSTNLSDRAEGIIDSLEHWEL
ncbi:MAG: hypothetical protein WBW16_14535 [Bacteroidota bacterium]